MDHQDQTKIAQPGHDSHAVYHCPKCGLAFPNSHPSSKYRRAHRRVCGKNQGGDEHQLSDEDPETPSPKIIARSRSGNVGIGGVSSRSEDELFADAVMEFPDAESGLVSQGSLYKDVEDCLPISGSITDAVVSDVTQLPKDSTDNSKSQIPTTFESGLRIILPHDHTSLGNEPTQSLNSEIRSKDSVVELSNDKTSSNDSRDSNQTQSPKAFESGLRIILPHDHTTSLDIEPIESLNSEIRPEDSVVKLSNDKTSPKSIPIKPETKDDCDMAIEAKEKKEIESISPKIAMLEDHVPGVNISSIEQSDSDLRTDDLAVEPHNNGKNSRHYSIKSETADVSKQNMEANMNDNKVQCLMSSSELESNTKENKEAEGNLMYVTVLPKKFADESFLVETSLKGIDKKLQSPLLVDRIVESNEERGDNLGASMSSWHHILDAESFQHSDGKFPDAVTAAVDPSKEIDVGKEDKMVEGIIMNEGVNEDVNMLSVPDNGPASKQTFLSLQSSGFGEFIDSSSVEACTFEDSLQNEDGGRKAAFEAASVETGSDSSEFKAVCSEIPQLKNVEVSMASALTETGSDINHKVCSHVEEFHKVQNGSEQMILPEAVITLTDEDLAAVDHASDHGKDEDGMWECDTVEKNDKEVATDENLVVSTIETSKDVQLTGDEKGKDSTDKNSKMDLTVAPKSANCSDDSQTVNNEISVKNSEEIESTYVDSVLDISRAGIDPTSMDYMTETDSNLPNLREKEVPEGIDDMKMHNNNKDQVEYVGVSTDAKSNQDLNVETLQKSSESTVRTKATPSPAVAQFSDQSISAIKDDKLCREVNADASVDSPQSDMAAVVDPKVLSSNDFKTPVDEEKANLMKQAAVSKGNGHKKLESFEPSSFMTLVEPKAAEDAKAESPEILTAQNLQESDLTLQAAWFPTLTHVPNESMGRKKNEEVIAKVTNWSTGQPHHSNLKSLLVEANLEVKAKSPNHAESIAEKYAASEKEQGDVATISKPDMSPEVPMSLAARVEAAKEWDSPARYPAAIKRDKKKLKTKPYWAQFVCCSSVN